MSAPVIVTRPARLPITLSETRAILKDPPSEEGYIVEAMQAATDYAETFLKRALITRTYDYYLDSFSSLILLPMPPAVSVASVNYYDADDVEQAVATTVYQADTISQPGRVVLLSGQSWPTLVDRSLRSLNRIRIRYDAGYGSNISDINPKIRMAILQLVAHFFRERQVIGPPGVLPMAMTGEALLEPFINHAS